MKFDLKLDPKTIVTVIVLIIGGILNLMLSNDAGILGPGLILALLALMGLYLVRGILQHTPEAWLGSLILYFIFILMAPLLNGYIYMGYDVFVIVFLFFVKDVFGIKFKREGPADAEAQLLPVSRMKNEDIDGLSQKMGVNLKNVRCPKCNSNDVVVIDDASAVCQSCRYGIMDVRKVARPAPPSKPAQPGPPAPQAQPVQPVQPAKTS